MISDHSTADESRSGQTPTLLVVGAGADWHLAAIAAQDADRIVSYSFEVAIQLESSLGYRVDVVDVSDQSREIDLQAWEWTTSLTANLTSHAQWLSSDVIEGTRRTLLQQVFWPIAAAREKARSVAGIVPSGVSVRAVGITPLERLSIETVFGPMRTDVDRRPLRMALRARAGRIMDAVFSFFRALSNSRISRRRISDLLKSFPSSPGDSPFVLAFVEVENHLKLLRSPLEQLRSRGWGLMALDLSQAGDLVENSATQFLSSTPFQQYVPAADNVGQISWGVRNRPRMRRLISDWGGSIGLEAYTAYLETGFYYHYTRSQSLLRAHQALLRRLRPSVILTVNEISQFVETAVPVARGMGIPTVNVQHGVLSEIALFSDFRFDRCCVWGEAYAEVLEKLGTDKGRIRVTGNPYMDVLGLDDREQKDAPLLNNDTEHTENTPFTILFIAGHSWDRVGDKTLYNTLSIVLESVEHSPDARIVIKLHPLGLGRELGYEVAISEHQNTAVVVTRNDDLYHLIETADCVVTQASTVGIEAASFRTPTILLTPKGTNDLLTLVAEGTALRAGTTEEFSECIRQIRAGSVIQESAYESVERRYSFGSDGSAGRRIADVCEGAAPRFGDHRG